MTRSALQKNHEKRAIPVMEICPSSLSLVSLPAEFSARQRLSEEKAEKIYSARPVKVQNSFGESENETKCVGNASPMAARNPPLRRKKIISLAAIFRAIRLALP